jgi:hypothetical protein
VPNFFSSFSNQVLRIRNKLREATDQSLPLPDVVCEQLEKHVNTIVQALPGDLQTVLHNGAGGQASADGAAKLLSPKMLSLPNQGLRADGKT